MEARVHVFFFISPFCFPVKNFFNFSSLLHSLLLSFSPVLLQSILNIHGFPFRAYAVLLPIFAFLSHSSNLFFCIIWTHLGQFFVWSMRFLLLFSLVWLIHARYFCTQAPDWEMSESSNVDRAQRNCIFFTFTFIAFNFFLFFCEACFCCNSFTNISLFVVKRNVHKI